MDDQPKSNIRHRITSDKIRIAHNIDLNKLFNLNYNFDLLKGIIEELLKNQMALQDQMDEYDKINAEKDDRISRLEKEIERIKMNQIDKKVIEQLQSDLQLIKEHLKRHDTQIEDIYSKLTQLEERLSKFESADQNEDAGRLERMIKALEEKTNGKLSEHDSAISDIINELNKLKQMLLELHEAHETTVTKVTANSTQIHDLNAQYKDLNEKFETTTKDLQRQIDELKKYIEKKLKELNSLIEILSSKPGNGGGDLKGLADLIKRVAQLESDYMEVQKEITTLHNIKADKKDMKDMESQLEALIRELHVIKTSMGVLQEKFDTHDDEIKKIKKSIEELLKAMEELKRLVNSRKQVVTSTDGKIDLSQYVHIDDFNSYKEYTNAELKSLNEQIEKIWKSIHELFELLKGKADKDDIEQLRKEFKQQLAELAKACNTKFADKNEVANNFRYLEQQIKKLFALLNNKSDMNGDNWLLAKKPLNGFSCASCEAYIGELRDNSQYVPWNKYPLRDPNEKLYRIGSGFSKMLQMLNIEGDQQNNNSTEGSNANMGSGNAQGFSNQRDYANDEPPKRMQQRGMSANVAMKRHQNLPNLQSNRKGFENNSSKGFAIGSNSAVVGSANCVQYEEQKEGPTITKIVKHSKK